jgi:hypothetical protein
MIFPILAAIFWASLLPKTIGFAKISSRMTRKPEKKRLVESIFFATFHPWFPEIFPDAAESPDKVLVSGFFCQKNGKRCTYGQTL